MRRLSLLRGLIFAVFAGLGAVAWDFAAAPIFGHSTALGLYCLGLVPWYAVAVAPTLRRGLLAFLMGGALIVPVSVLAPGHVVAFAVTPFVLGLLRSAVLFPRPFARAVYLEVGFGLLALLLAALLFGSNVFSASLAVWTFWLVQAGFALAPGEPAPSRPDEGDPFEAAHARALAVLEQGRK